MLSVAEVPGAVCDGIVLDGIVVDGEVVEGEVVEGEVVEGEVVDGVFTWAITAELASAAARLIAVRVTVFVVMSLCSF